MGYEMTAEETDKTKAKAEQLAQIARADLNEARAIAELNHAIKTEIAR
jgi:hypothetical protein